MTCLGFDTATPSTSVALLTADGTLHEAADEVPPGSRGHHAERVLELAGGLLERAGIGWSGIERIAVGRGPGGYTGLRIGIATARCLARAHGAELVGVGTLRVLAEPVVEGSALAVIDARRGELFVAAYADGVELLAPAVLAPDALASVALALGADEGPLLALGDGARAHRVILEQHGIGVAPDASVLHRVSAGALCRLAATVLPQEVGAAVDPIYLRLPDAERSLQAPLR